MAASIQPKLAHVVSDLTVGSVTAHVLDLVQVMPEYNHTVLFEGNVLQADTNLMHALSMAGAQLIHVSRTAERSSIGAPSYGEVTPAMLRDGGYAGGILHSLAGHAGLGKAIPSLYYAYGVYDPAVEADIVVCCTDYSRRHGRVILKYTDILKDAPVIHPGIQSRYIRNIKRDNAKMVVGMCSSSVYDKFHEPLARYLITRLDATVPLCIVTNATIKQRLQTVAYECRKPVTLVEGNGTINNRIYKTVDILVHGFRHGYHSPYTRTAIEAMCAGIPVVCQRSGFLSEQLTHGKHCLFFDTRKEALDHVNLLLREPETAKQLGLNGRLWAMGQDIIVYTNELRVLLRQLGV